MQYEVKNKRLAEWVREVAELVQPERPLVHGSKEYTA